VPGSRSDRGYSGRGGPVQPVAVRLDEVGKTYPNGKQALIDVDLVIPVGDFVFLVGPSGAGKSTLIKLLVHDEEATGGTVQVAGLDLDRLRRGDVPRLRRQIGIVFQDFRLLPRKTVSENVAFALEVTGTPSRQIAPAVERVLALVGLTEQAEQRPAQLSGGELQRTAILGAPDVDDILGLHAYFGGKLGTGVNIKDFVAAADFQDPKKWTPGRRIRFSAGWGTLLTNDFRGCDPAGGSDFDPVSLICKVSTVEGKPAVKLSDNYAKALGTPEEIERYSRLFGTAGMSDLPVIT